MKIHTYTKKQTHGRIYSYNLWKKERDRRIKTQTSKLIKIKAHYKDIQRHAYIYLSTHTYDPPHINA